MDGVPQTTFIPRKPVSDAPQIQPRGGNMFLTFGWLVLAVAVLSAGGVFAYQRFFLQRTVDQDQTTLQNDIRYFDSALISQMTTLSNQLSATQTVLNQHVGMSRLFSFLANSTIASVRFNKFSYSTNAGAMSVNLDGQAASFAALDAQELQFLAPSSLFKSPTISNIAVTKNGTITFTLTASLSTSDLLYKNEVSGNAVTPTVPTLGAVGSSSPTIPLQ